MAESLLVLFSSPEDDRATIGALLVLLWAYVNLRRTLGGSVAVVHDSIARIGRGDLAGTIHVPPGREDSVLADLAVMQQQLKTLAAERQQVEADLRVAALIEV